jgi:hypothetical protein
MRPGRVLILANDVDALVFRADGPSVSRNFSAGSSNLLVGRPGFWFSRPHG